MTTVETNSPEETLRLGKSIGMMAVPGEVYALDGDLGAGKTVFAKGVAEGLGVEDAVSSPTFTILQEYREGRLPFYHFDVYRVEDPEEMHEVGLDEYLTGDGVCLIEWAERIPELLPETATRIRITTDPARGADYRLIRIDTKEGPA